MATKLKKMANQLNENFRVCLDTEFEKQFGVNLVTEFNIFSMQLVSYREDEEDLTEEQMTFVKGYSEGYTTAMVQVREAQ